MRVRNEANAYANKVIPEARGEAQRYLEEAEAYRRQLVAEARGESSVSLSCWSSIKSRLR